MRCSEDQPLGHGRYKWQNLLVSFSGRVNGQVLVVALGSCRGNHCLRCDRWWRAMSGDPERPMAAIGPIAGIVLLVVGVGAFWISLAVAVKRYHDRNKTGWWVLIVLVP